MLTPHVEIGWQSFDIVFMPNGAQLNQFKLVFVCCVFKKHCISVDGKYVPIYSFVDFVFYLLQFKKKIFITIKSRAAKFVIRGTLKTEFFRTDQRKKVNRIIQSTYSMKFSVFLQLCTFFLRFFLSLLFGYN